ncbi:peptidase S24-like protein [Aerococcus christensenii]|uniref:Peptidase S24-like protein n=1 Tax=Aerococcus christensenii TaxID=87541 RepID=A0A133XXB9_9LACT|nr:XRE family transcriptional regulator [Aerococcus christensenii]KXB35596.1 peptidase S24-like protein [Aerococcus christensenii]
MALGNKEIFANNLKKYMAKYGIDRNKLCADLNFKYMTVSDWINAKTYPRIDKIEILASYFNIKKSDLVEEKSFHSSPLLDQITKKAAKLYPPRQKKVLTFTQDQLDEQEGRVEEERQTFRLRKSAAGLGIYVDDDEYNYEVVTSSKVPHGADELVKILGDSMEPLIMKGEKVYIHHQPMVENGEIAIVRIGEEEVTCKHVYINKKEVTLKSENPKYDDMHYDAEKITILGKVIL